MFLPVFVCLSVCLSVSKITQKRVRMGLGERVVRCRDMDELINFLARSRLQSECRNRIAFSDIVCAATRNLLRRENPILGIGRTSLQRRVVLKWFYSPRAVGTTMSEVHALYRVLYQFIKRRTQQQLEIVTTNRPVYCAAYTVHRCHAIKINQSLFANDSTMKTINSTTVQTLQRG